MVVVKLLLTTAVVAALSVSAAIAPVTASLDAAQVILESGDAVKAKLIAKTLRSQSPQLAALYELEWIASRIKARRRGVRSPVQNVEIDDSQLAWKASAEIWQDEWNSYLTLPRVRDTQNELIPNAEELAAIRTVLRRDTSLDGGVLNPDVEDTLITLIYNDWAQGKDTQVSNKVFKWIQTADKAGAHRCQWSARNLLSDNTQSMGPEKLEPWAAWKQSCSSCEGRFCTVADLKVADSYTALGKYEQSLEIYQARAREVKTPSPQLQYRIAALQILAAKPVQNILRAAAPLFVNEGVAGEDEPVNPAQRAAIRSHICEELSSLNAQTLKTIATRVYTDRAWIAQMRSWILTCSLSQSQHIASIAKLPSLNEMQRDSVRMALEVRNSQARHEKQRLKKDTLAAGTIEGTLGTSAKKLSGVLKIPVLFPFPEMQNETVPFRIGNVFSRAVNSPTRGPAARTQNSQNQNSKNQNSHQNYSPTRG